MLECSLVDRINGLMKAYSIKINLFYLVFHSLAVPVVAWCSFDHDSSLLRKTITINLFYLVFHSLAVPVVGALLTMIPVF